VIQKANGLNMFNLLEGVKSVKYITIEGNSIIKSKEERTYY